MAPPGNEPAHLVVIGNTGSGKSQLLNALAADDNMFVVGDNVESVTNCTESKQKCIPLDGGEPYPMKLTDTPGLGDTFNRDADRKVEMLTILREQQQIHCLAVVLNYKSPRFDTSLQQLVECIELEFGIGIWSFAVLVFTHYEVEGLDEAEDESREKQNDQRKRAKQLEWSNAIKQRLAGMREVLGDDPLPCFFLDSRALLDSDEDIKEKLQSQNRRESVMAELRKIKKQHAENEAEKLLIILRSRCSSQHRFATLRMGKPRILRWAEPGSLTWFVGRRMEVAPPQVENEPSYFNLEIAGASSLEILGLQFDEETGILSGEPTWVTCSSLTFTLTATNKAGDSEPFILDGKQIQLSYPQETINELQTKLQSDLNEAKKELPLDDLEKAQKDFKDKASRAWAKHGAGVLHKSQQEALEAFFNQQKDIHWNAHMQVHEANREKKEEARRREEAEKVAEAQRQEAEEESRRREQAEKVAELQTLEAKAKQQEAEDQTRRREEAERVADAKRQEASEAAMRREEADRLAEAQRQEALKQTKRREEAEETAEAERREAQKEAKRREEAERIAEAQSQEAKEEAKKREVAERLAEEQHREAQEEARRRERAETLTETHKQEANEAAKRREEAEKVAEVHKRESAEAVRRREEAEKVAEIQKLEAEEAARRREEAENFAAARRREAEEETRRREDAERRAAAQVSEAQEEARRIREQEAKRREEAEKHAQIKHQETQEESKRRALAEETAQQEQLKRIKTEEEWRCRLEFEECRRLEEECRRIEEEHRKEKMRAQARQQYRMEQERIRAESSSTGVKVAVAAAAASVLLLGLRRTFSS